MLEHIRKARLRLSFDASWYLKMYPDVREAIDKGLFKSAFDHYWQFGPAEGRLPNRPFVDEDWYLQVYEDVRGALERGEFASAFEHFIRIGYRERRQPAPLHKQVRLPPPRRKIAAGNTISPADQTAKPGVPPASNANKH